MTVTRRQAREWAIQMLTSADLNPPTSGDGKISNDLTAFMESFWTQVTSIDPAEGLIEKIPNRYKVFAEERVAGVLHNLDAIDDVLVPLLNNWDLYRLGTVERAVLRMGVWEMMNTDVPHAVVINEAIDIVNWFSAPVARKIVNGVLDKYAKSLDAAKASEPEA